MLTHIKGGKMNINMILKVLGISKLRAAWSIITGGVSGLLALIASAFTALLRKAEPEKLKYYADFSSKLAKFVRYGVELFVTGECYKKAGITTADALVKFAEHIADGEYTKEELDEDIDFIDACIGLWKEAPECEREAL